MRTEKKILADLEAAQSEYHEAASTLTDATRRNHTQSIRTLRDELAALFTEGAMPCPHCANPPHGMRKNRTEVEVGCLVCGIRSREGSILEAVRAWNAREYHLPARGVGLRLTPTAAEK
jgi:hypothetical protein